jgi:anaerobic ribonucleoside-triphosphate reductase
MRIIEVNPSKETSAIVVAGEPTGDFGQRAKKNVDLVENYIQKLDWKVRENSNMSYSLQGLNNFISSDVTSQYWLNRIYPPEIRHAHENGDIHTHDLSMLSAYCVGSDLKDLLKQGFKKGVRMNLLTP